MTALTTLGRKSDQIGNDAVPDFYSYPVAASTTIRAGAIVATNASGNAVPASANNTFVIQGRAEHDADNSAGAAAALLIRTRRGTFNYNMGSGADAITIANRGQICYVIDDNTVGLTDAGGARPAAGRIEDVVGTQVSVALAMPSLSAMNADIGGGGVGVDQRPFTARGVVIANVSALATFTVANNGITYVVGDIVVLTAQTTASQNGPYVVGTVATGTAPLTRPDWWATGKTIAQGRTIEVGSEGTLLGGSSWKAMCITGKIVDTDDPVLYPRTVKSVVTLVAGTVALGSTQGLFLYSTTTSTVQATRKDVGGTVTSTIQYGCPSAASARVAGVSGTAVATVTAEVAAGTVNVADTSTVDVTVTNW